jgi:hypothetical protein
VGFGEEREGLRPSFGRMETLARDLELEPLLVFLADASVPGPLDELVRAEIPRLMAALLVLAGRVIAVLEAQNASSVEHLALLLRRGPGRPTRRELERAARVLELTL